MMSVSVQYEYLHTILYNLDIFFNGLGVGVGQCERTIDITWDRSRFQSYCRFLVCLVSNLLIIVFVVHFLNFRPKIIYSDFQVKNVDKYTRSVQTYIVD